MDINKKVKSLEGHPKQYRFDAKEGVFNLNGTEKLGRTFTFQPIAWRIFTDDILGMGKKNWAEIFFIDDLNCVSAILFHGYSVDNIFRLIEPLYYDDLMLKDVVITAVAEKKENAKVQPKGVYYIATFSYSSAVKELIDFCDTFTTENKIYRTETLTDIMQVKSAYKFYNPYNEDDLAPELVAGATRAQLDKATDAFYNESSDETSEPAPTV